MSKNFRISLIASTILLMAFCQFNLLKAQSDNSAQSTDQTLSKLESRFFEHQYSNDTDSDRLNRLETFVFGCTQTGAVNARIQHILSTLPDENADKIENPQLASTDSSNDTQSSNVASTNQDTNNDVNTSSEDGQQTADAPAGKAFDYSSYPSVTCLEQQLFGHTYTSDTLSRRLTRLETKAFGLPSTSNDLSARVDKLEDYAQRNDLYNEHSIASNPNNGLSIAPIRPIARNNRVADDAYSEKNLPTYANQQQYISKTGSFVGSVEERVSMMEAQAFGHTYPDRPLDKRLNKLEKKLLPNQDDSQLGLFERTGKLWVALHPADKSKVDNFIANHELVDDRIVSKDSNNVESIPAPNLIADADVPVANSGSSSTSRSNTSSPSNNTNQLPKRYSWLSKLGTSLGSPGYMANDDSDGSPAGVYSPPAPGIFNYSGGAVPAGYTSRSYGASFGPGAGPAGLPVGFW